MKVGEAWVEIKAKMDKYNAQLRTAQSKTKTAASRMQGHFKSLRGGVDRVSRSIFSLKTGIIALVGAYGLGKLAKGFLDVADQTETLQLRLSTLLGSTEEAGRMFDDLSGFAAKVPFTFGDIAESATMLAGVLKGGREDIMQYMPMISDLAAATGVGIIETTGQFMRMVSAGIGACDLWREKGVKAMLGFTDGVKYSAKESTGMFVKAWEDTDSKFRGATEKLKTSWSGMLSMFSDAWREFRQAVMDSDVFASLKISASALLEQISELKEQGKLDEWAKSMAETCLKIFQNLIKGLGFLGKAILSLQAAWRLVKDAFVDMATTTFENLAKMTDKLSVFADIGALLGMPSYAKLGETLRGWSKDAEQLAKDFEFMGVESEAAVDKSSTSISKWEKGIETLIEKTTGLKTEIVKTADEIKHNLTPAITNVAKGMKLDALPAAIKLDDALFDIGQTIKLDTLPKAIDFGNIWGSEIFPEIEEATEGSFGSGGSISSIFNNFFGVQAPSWLNNLVGLFGDSISQMDSMVTGAFGEGGSIWTTVAGFFAKASGWFAAFYAMCMGTSYPKGAFWTPRQRGPEWGLPGPDIAPYECPVCGRGFRTERSLEIHMQHSHSGVGATTGATTGGQVVLNPQPVTININWTSEVAGHKVQTELFKIITEATADGKITISPTSVRTE